MAGVLFALLFGATLILIRVKMPEGVGNSAEWLDSQKGGISAATKLMPFAGEHVKVTGKDYVRNGSHALVIETISR